MAIQSLTLTVHGGTESQYKTFIITANTTWYDTGIGSVYQLGTLQYSFGVGVLQHFPTVARSATSCLMSASTLHVCICHHHITWATIFLIISLECECKATLCMFTLCIVLGCDKRCRNKGSSAGMSRHLYGTPGRVPISSPKCEENANSPCSLAITSASKLVYFLFCLFLAEVISRRC